MNTMLCLDMKSYTVCDWNLGPSVAAATTLSADTACAAGVVFIRSHRFLVTRRRSTIVPAPVASGREMNVQRLHRCVSSFGRPSRNGTAIAARVTGRRPRFSSLLAAAFFSRSYACSAPARHAHTTSFTVHPNFCLAAFRSASLKPSQVTIRRFPEYATGAFAS